MWEKKETERLLIFVGKLLGSKGLCYYRKPRSLHERMLFWNEVYIEDLALQV